MLHIPTYQAAGPDQHDQLSELQQLQAGLAASLALSVRLEAVDEPGLCERIGAVLHQAAGFEHSFVGLQADGLPRVCAYRSGARAPLEAPVLADIARHLLDGLPPGAIAVRTAAGLRFVAVALSADGAGVAGALCFALGAGAAFDAGALVQLAQQAALRLALARTAPATVGAIGSEVLKAAVNHEFGLLRTLVDNMPDHIYAKDRNGRFILGNRAAAIGILGRDDVPALIGKSDLDFFPLACGQRFFTDEQTIIRTGQPIVDQIEENVTKDGPLRYFSTTKFPFHDARGEIAGIVGISRDITARVGADEIARLRDRAVESSQDGILITCAADQDYPIIYTNPAFERLTGFGTEEAKRAGIERFLRDQTDDERPLARQAVPRQDASDRRALIAAHGAQRTLRFLRRDASRFWCEVRLATICAADGSASHHVFTFVDVTAAHQAEEELIHLASYDTLTGLPNRRLLLERLDRDVRTGAAAQAGLAVAFIDLDGLKRLNDEHGHDAGDVLLRAVADRITACIRRSDMIARLGGDEFVLLSAHGNGAACDPQGIGQFLCKVRDAIAQPLVVAGTTLVPRCSIGVSILGRHGNDAETLLKRADAAMYAAKRSGRGRIAFADDA
ncbi:diguanylate cyclase domain-containing protein [Massilia varians]